MKDGWVMPVVISFELWAVGYEPFERLAVEIMPDLRKLTILKCYRIFY